VLIGIFSELDAPGGVQRASRHIAAVLTEFAASRSMECRLFSLNDSPELHRMSVGGREFVFTGCERAKGRFAATAFRTARRHAKLVLAGHPNLAPVTQTMRLAAPRMKTIICTHGIEVWEGPRKVCSCLNGLACEEHSQTLHQRSAASQQRLTP